MPLYLTIWPRSSSSSRQALNNRSEKNLKRLQKGQDALYITERGVLRLGPEGLTHTEVAPGIDVEEHIAKQVGLEFRVAKEPRQMDARIFKEEPMGLKESADSAR